MRFTSKRVSPALLTSKSTGPVFNTASSAFRTAESSATSTATVSHSISWQTQSGKSFPAELPFSASLSLQPCARRQQRLLLSLTGARKFHGRCPFLLRSARTELNGACFWSHTTRARFPLNESELEESDDVGAFVSVEVIGSTVNSNLGVKFQARSTANPAK